MKIQYQLHFLSQTFGILSMKLYCISIASILVVMIWLCFGQQVLNHHMTYENLSLTFNGSSSSRIIMNFDVSF